MEERPIAFNLLHKDELEYEVSIRGAKPTDTVTSLRAQVRALNRDIPTDEIITCDLDISTELTAVQAKLESLDNLVLGTTQKACSLKILNRVQALAHHLYHRLGRFAPEGDVQLQAILTLCQERLNRTLVKLDNLLHTFHSSLRESQTIDPASNDTLVRPDTKDALGVVEKHSAIHTLNLKFNGKTCVKAFIQRLEELCLSRRISDIRLFNSAAELFSDEALCWYRGVRTEVDNWTGLKQLLIDEYLPFDYDHRLMIEIRGRSQGPDETIINYLSVMQNYFARLSKTISDVEKLNIVLFNLRPFYTTQLALNPAETWSDLKRKCRLLEHAKQRSELFTEPPKTTASCLAPDLSYKGQRLTKVHVVQTTGKEDFCVRCRVDGHHLTNCTAPFILVCYRCGEKDYTFKNCPKCSVKPPVNPASKN